jgi:hypothetical protein
MEEHLEYKARRILDGMPKRRPWTSLDDYMRNVWSWQWLVELEHAEDWRLLERVGILMHEQIEVIERETSGGCAEADSQNLRESGEPGAEDPGMVAMAGEYMMDSEWMRDLSEAGLNFTLAAAAVMWNERVSAAGARRLYGEYIRLCRKFAARPFVAWDVSTGGEEWLLCAMRIPGEGRVRLGLDDEFVVESEPWCTPIRTHHAGFLGDHL